MIADGTAVRRLRLRAPSAATADAALQVERILAAASVHPSALPGSSVLCVRRLADPRPGALRVDSGSIRPPGDWEAAVAETLGRELRHAARPAREAVPAGANAVLFADRSELLACLAADWLSGSLGARWWWLGLTGRGPARAVVLDAWREAPRHAPAAIELLAERGRAGTFADALAPAEALRLAEAIATAFALPDATTAVVGHGLSTAAARPHGAPARAGPSPPWIAVAPDVAGRGLAPEGELLLGLALALRRAPVAVRAPAFAEALRRWAVTALEPPAAEESPGRRPPPETRRGPVRTRERSAPVPAEGPSPAPRAQSPGPWEPARPDAIAMRAGEPQPALEARPAPAGPQPRAAPLRPSRPIATDHDPAIPPAPATARAPAAPAPPLPAADAPPGRARDSHGEPATAVRRPARRDRREPAPDVTSPQPPDPAEPVPAVTPPSAPEAVETGLGGLFFLLSLALHLGLVADFSEPGDPGAGLDPWDLIALLGAELLDEPHPSDPVWALLARLAGRDPVDPPGRDWQAPRDWRLPPAWLAPWPDPGVWAWSAARGRLRVQHPAGFPLLDVHGGASALGGELARFTPGPRALRRGRLPAVGGRGRAATRWARRLAAYARPRLVLGLGLDEPGDLAGVLLRRPARVHVTPVHVEVEFALAEHPVEVRMAGLDRDPGWVPAAGRLVAFRFR